MIRDSSQHFAKAKFPQHFIIMVFAPTNHALIVFYGLARKEDPIIT